MSSMYGTSKYVIEGENAAKVYAAIVDSSYYRKRKSNPSPGFNKTDKLSLGR